MADASGESSFFRDSSATYEFAEMTCMQAVAGLSMMLFIAEMTAANGPMVDCSSSLVQAARLADYLCETDLRDRIAKLHADAFVRPSDGGTARQALSSACRALQVRYKEMLRENDTRYIPTASETTSVRTQTKH